MIVFDAHCDTLTEIIKRKENLFDNTCHIDIKRLLLNKTLHSYSHVQTFAAFSGKDPVQGETNIINQILKLKTEVTDYSCNINICRRLDDIFTTVNDGKIAALLSVEGLNFIDNSIDVIDNEFLKFLINNGVKMIAPSWNYSGNICCSCFDDEDYGLSNYGRDFIKYLNEKSIIIDVSHMSERSFDDVIALATKPVAASHSNCKSICNHVRNLSNSKIKQIAENRGIICVNFYQLFLKNTGEPRKRVSIDTIIKHIEFIASLVGIDFIGIGSDFDGIDLPVSDLRDCSFLYKLIDKMQMLNYHNTDIEKIMWGNFLRVMKLNEVNKVE